MHTIYYLGPNGSYSQHMAAKLYAKDKAMFFCCDSFSAVAAEVESNPDAIGVLPVENSTTSDVHENIDTLFSRALYICQEGFLAVSLHLFVLPKAQLKNITTVCSHPQALAQCTFFMQKHNLQPMPVASTAAGKEMVLKGDDLTQAVIGGRDLGADDKLALLAENIGNEQRNFSRFVCITSRPPATVPAIAGKVSVICGIKHEPGALARLLTALAAHNINLTKIESRPVAGSEWEYVFWLDCECESIEQRQHFVRVMEEETQSYKIKGWYAKGKKYQS